MFAAQGTKGTGGSILILEEAARIDPALFKETIAPLLLVEHTALIGITTPMEEGNDYNVMMQLKYENGDPMFNAIAITLMCESCKKVGALECPHCEHEIPPWKRDKKRARLVQSIMSSDRTMYLRENAGVVQTLDNCAFDHSTVDNAFREPEISISEAMPSLVFVCIDTAGGGQSCTAICSGFFNQSHKMVVAGAESLVISNDFELEKSLREHLTSLRKSVGTNALFVTIIEQNYGGWVGASRVAGLCDAFQPCLHMSRDRSGKGKIGVVTTHEAKEAMRFALQDRLRSERFAFASPFVSSSPEIREEMRRQLKAYRQTDTLIKLPIKTPSAC